MLSVTLSQSFCSSIVDKFVYLISTYFHFVVRSGGHWIQTWGSGQCLFGRQQGVRAPATSDLLPRQQAYVSFTSWLYIHTHTYVRTCISRIMLLNEVLGNESWCPHFWWCFLILQGSICPSISAKGFFQLKKKDSMIYPLSWHPTQEWIFVTLYSCICERVVRTCD